MQEPILADPKQTGGKYGWVILRCDECGRRFYRNVSLQNAAIKAGNKAAFCGRVCSGRNRLKVSYKPRRLWKKTGAKVTCLSAYREMVHRCSQRKKWPIDIDTEYLHGLWKAQKGKCALSGLPMLPLPVKRSKSYKHGPRSAFKASLDRIDSKIGYLKGNVQWVCTIANLAKADFSEQDLLLFCRAVAEKNESTNEIETDSKRVQVV